MAKAKFYVVWEGNKTGIFTEWVECQTAIKGHRAPKYKGYKSLQEAERALAEGYIHHWGKGDSQTKFYSQEELKLIGVPIVPSVYLFSSMDLETRIMTYKGMDTASGEILFQQGPFFDCDQHIGCYLALVHALAFLAKQGSEIPIYTRSAHARAWVGHNKLYGGLLQPTERNKRVFELVGRADKWLVENVYKNQIFVWNKRAWGYPGNLLVDLQVNATPQVGQ